MCLDSNNFSQSSSRMMFSTVPLPTCFFSSIGRAHFVFARNQDVFYFSHCLFSNLVKIHLFCLQRIFCPNGNCRVIWSKSYASRQKSRDRSCNNLTGKRLGLAIGLRLSQDILVKPQAAQTLFVIYIRDSIALRFKPFKIMYENGSKIALNSTCSKGFK